VSQPAHHYPAPIEEILTAQQRGAASLLDDAPCPYPGDTDASDFLRQMWCRGRVAGKRTTVEGDTARP
jgi:hypothetical protein